MSPANASARATRSRGRGRRTDREETSATAAAPAYIERKIPYFDFLDEEALVAIETQADYLLQEIGIDFRDDPETLEIWKDAGADVKGEHVRLPNGMCRELLKTAPRVITQHARNPEKTVKIGGTNQVFAPIYGAPFFRSLDEGRRYGTLEDLQKLIKLTHMTPYLHHSGGIICEPCDIPVNKRHLDIVYSHIKYNDQPYLGMITEKSRCEDSVEMTRILFGADYMEQHCCVMGNVNVNSPLMFDKVATHAIRTYCGANQGIIVVPFILGGAMGPVTVAGAVAQALAEAMAGGALSQLVRPGSSFVLGNFLSSMSLKSGAPPFGMPEPTMSNYMVGQLARRLGVPLRCGGSLTASKLADAQSAAESADSMHSTALGGSNYTLHSAGWSEAGLVTNIEKFMMDIDRLGSYQRMLGGVATDRNGLATDAYAEASPGDHMLGNSHTMANYQTAYYDSKMSNSESFEQWEDEGAKDSVVRANERWKQQLNDYQAPPLDEAKDEELREFIDKKKASMEDAWY
ncbi:MAG: trimethylamine methyltransferase family protein [Pseudomonadota bacterium]